MIKRYRLGGHWKTTIIEYDLNERPDAAGRRPSDRLVAVAQTERDAITIVHLMNFAAEQR